MNEVIVVSSYIPLPVRHLTEEQYRALGGRLAAASSAYRFHLFEHSLEECWLHSEPGLPWVPAYPPPADRYATPEDNIRSHIIQHNRTEWALAAARQYPDANVIVWFDYGLLKQDAGGQNSITDAHVREFLYRVAHYPFERTMPFPGILSRRPVEPFGHNWRFCGSVHIWPVKWLAAIDRVYKESLRRFIQRYNRVPLDLAIWPEVEEVCTSHDTDPGTRVPFHWYQGEYNASQLTGFPEQEPS